MSTDLNVPEKILILQIDLNVRTYKSEPTVPGRQLRSCFKSGTTPLKSRSQLVQKIPGFVRPIPQEKKVTNVFRELINVLRKSWQTLQTARSTLCDIRPEPGSGPYFLPGSASATVGFPMETLWGESFWICIVTTKCQQSQRVLRGVCTVCQDFLSPFMSSLNILVQLFLCGIDQTKPGILCTSFCQKSRNSPGGGGSSFT